MKYLPFVKIRSLVLLVALVIFSGGIVAATGGIIAGQSNERKKRPGLSRSEVRMNRRGFLRTLAAGAVALFSRAVLPGG